MVAGVLNGNGGAIGPVSLVGLTKNRVEWLLLAAKIPESRDRKGYDVLEPLELVFLQGCSLHVDGTTAPHSGNSF